MGAVTTIFAAMRTALLVVTGGSGDWQTARRLDGHDLECVAVHPNEPNRVFCGTFDAGLQRSLDGGDTWDRVGDAIESDAVMSVAVNPDDPDEVWAGTEPSRVYRSLDGGDSWEHADGLVDLPSASRWSFPPRPHTHHVRWIEVDPVDPDHAFVGIEAGALVQTHDGGDTWEDRVASSRIDTHSMTTHPGTPGRVWTAAGDGYAESADGGRTWTTPQEGLAHRYCWSVAVDASDPDLVLVSSAHGPWSAHTAETADSYVYRKRGAEAWERLDGRGLPLGDGVTRAVLQSGSSGGTFLAVSNRGLFGTSDAGNSWYPLDIDWPEEFETQAARGLAVVADASQTMSD